MTRQFQSVLPKMSVTIENLPIELIEVIFNQLNLNDIGNCFRASKRWQSLISEVYKNKGMLKLCLI